MFLLNLEPCSIDANLELPITSVLVKNLWVQQGRSDTYTNVSLLSSLSAVKERTEGVGQCNNLSEWLLCNSANTDAALLVGYQAFASQSTDTCREPCHGNCKESASPLPIPGNIHWDKFGSLQLYHLVFCLFSLLHKWPKEKKKNNVLLSFHLFIIPQIWLLASLHE